MTEKLFKNALLIQIISVIINVLGMVVDGAVTGSCLGTDAMAAYGFVIPVTTLFTACSCVCGIGTSVLVGRLVGARNLDESAKALSSCIIFSLCFSAVLIVIFYPFSHEIAGLLGANGPINEMASDYLRGISLCAPALLLMVIAFPIVQIDGNGPLVIIATIVMTVVNVTGDLLNGLVLNGGLWGMALATTISYYVALFIIITPFLRKKNTIPLSFSTFDFKYVKEMITSGLADGIQQVCRSLLILSLNAILLQIADNDAIAVRTAIMSAACLCMALGSGIGSSASLLTGVFSGEEDDKAIRELMKIAIKKSILYNAIFCAFLLVGSGLLMPLFLNEPELISMAVLGFRLYCISMVGYSINVTLRSYYQAMNLSLFSYIYVFLNTFLFTTLSAYILGHTIGINGVWLSFFFGETITLLMLALYISIKDKSKKGFWEKFLLIPSDFSSKIQSRLDAKISELDELEKSSEEIYQFCIANNSSKRTAYLMSLAVEEIGVRSLKGAKSLEIRVLSKTDCWTLRIRDDGKRYNPLELFTGETEEDFSYFGVRMLNKLISNMDYTNTLNMNNLNITINREEI